MMHACVDAHSLGSESVRIYMTQNSIRDLGSEIRNLDIGSRIQYPKFGYRISDPISEIWIWDLGSDIRISDPRSDFRIQIRIFYYPDPDTFFRIQNYPDPIHITN